MKRAVAAHDLDLALLGQRRRARRSARRRRPPSRRAALEIDLRLAERDAVRGHLLGLGDHARRVQQRLGRDAADVQADAAERLVALDQDRPAGRDRRRGRRRCSRPDRRRARELTRRAPPRTARGAAGRGELRARRRCGAASRVRAAPVTRRSVRLASGRRSGSAPRLDSVSSRLALGDPIADLDRQLERPCPRPAPARPSSPCRISSVTSGSSTATSSPGLTQISMTGTSSKSPMSGTRTSTSLTAAPRRRIVCEHRDEMRDEARGSGAVDHAMVVGQRQRQHQPRHELAAVPDRLHRRAR